MNFVVTRAEITALTGVGRTETFRLQKISKLPVCAGTTGKCWFELEQVLICVAELRDLPMPDRDCVELHAKLIVEQRLKKMA